MPNIPERIMTLHPEGKTGVNILKAKYDQIKDFIIEQLETNGGEMSYKELNEAAEQELPGKFEGSIPWYLVSVKLDLEARKASKRIPNTSPHRQRLNT